MALLRRTITTALLALPLASLLPAAQARAAGEVNLYTTRESGLVKPLLDAFTARTGIAVNTVFVKDGLAERVAAEGTRSPADVLMTVDLGQLVDLDRKGLTQKLGSAAAEAAVPAALRDPEANWVPLSLRARVILVSKDRVADTAMTYEDLANPRFKGKLCIRAGNHPYNTALIAAMITKKGEAATEAWLEGMKANLARKPGGGDRDVARDILAGTCDVGITNSYYMGLMLSGAGGEQQKKWADAVRVILPTFADGTGTHVNVSGAAIARNAPHAENARRLVEFLLTPEAQKIYAEANFEFPVLAGVALHPVIAHLGTLKPDNANLTAIATQRAAASKMVDKVGFDK
jgi:iron(III) transport system substrate-binding protein